MNFYVYILKNDTDNDLYKGFTENPNQRIIYHNLGLSKFTSTKKNLSFVFLKKFDTKSEALKFERKIKKWNRKSLDALICSKDNIIESYFNQ
jgi:putative endonuclease